MAVSFELPREIESNLRRSLGDLDGAAKEAALIELYRQGTLTGHELSRGLGLSRLETEAVLKMHNVIEDLPSAAEIEQDVDNLRRVLDR